MNLSIYLFVYLSNISRTNTAKGKQQRLPIFRIKIEKT